jgi:ribosomal protein S18 acetylase RimI-like enzyme
VVLNKDMSELTLPVVCQNGQFEIDVARPGDARPICRVMAETWMDTYQNEEHGITADMIRARQYDPDGSISREKIALTERSIADSDFVRRIFTARMNGEVVGVSSVSDPEIGKRKINTLYVLPNVQGMRIGSALLETGLGWLDRREADVYLKVATFNQKAINLYTKYGFIPTGPVPVEDQMQFDNGIILPELEMIRRVSRS